MKFEELVNFIEHEMRMSHIYQPLLIRSLVDSGGSATLRQLAQIFCVQDESELIRYEDTIKKMPLKVLSKHGIVACEGQLVSLTVRHLELRQRAKLKQICEQRMREFICDRGLGIWSYRMLDNPVPATLRYRVLMEGGQRCALCGATHDDQPLDVDHIKPRSKGGPTTMDNLQILCAQCNGAKGNKDDTDFRSSPTDDDTDSKCPFCQQSVQDNVTESLGTCLALDDGFPVSTGHTLVIPRRHTT